ncbi:MAG: DUF924 family protein [Acetobacteraceae bacterium]
MEPDDVLDFWFAGDPAAWRPAWFRRDAALDAGCVPFVALRQAARDGALDQWTETPRGALALLILLDQMSRNLYRGTAEAFAADTQARAIARAALARGFDATLTPVERVFLYLPFEHSEDPTDQQLAVRLFEALEPIKGAAVAKYASRHRDVICRFGRFPHRNAALGRESTVEELAYLAEPDAGF